MIGFITCSYTSDEIKGNEVDGLRSLRGGGEKCLQNHDRETLEETSWEIWM